VQLDGMGTAHRSKAFHDVCWKNLRDAGFAGPIEGSGPPGGWLVAVVGLIAVWAFGKAFFNFRFCR